MTPTPRSPLPTRHYPLLLVTLFALPLLSPFFRLTSACTHDGHLHYHRVAAMFYAWQNGLFFSRWLPDLAFGYGYPFFLYREGAPLYLTLIPHALGLPLPAAVNLFYMVCILAAGWFMYLWVRDIFGPLSGIVAAVAYMAAPYQLIDAIIRGNQPESLALPLFPLLLWSGRRFMRQNSAVPFLVSVFGLLFLALSHNISLLLFTPILFIYLIFIAWLERLDLKTAVTRIGLVFILGLGLTAFYVGPALLELDEITISQSVTTRNNDFRLNFATLGEIFAPVKTADPSLLNQPLLIRLGWMPTLLALAGVVRFAAGRGLRNKAGQRDEKRGHVILMVVAVIGLLFMSLTLARPLWENLPLIEFVQFPWRFVGRAALPLAFLAGTTFASTKTTSRQLPTNPTNHSPNYQSLLACAAILLLLLEALPYLYPHYCRDEAYPTILTVQNYEHSTGLVGVDPEGSYFPITVQQRPSGSPLEADYQAGRTPQRFDAAQLPQGATIQSVNYSHNSAEVSLTTPESFQARYLTFAFPGWTVLVDGQEAAITPTDPEGLITFPVPAGAHTIQIRWQMTPIRQLMTLVSLLCLLGVIITAVRLPVTQFGKSPPQHQQSKTAFKPLIITALLLLALKLLIIDNIETPIRRETGPVVDNPATLQANELQFAGYNLSRQSVPSGDTFDIDLAWLTLAQPEDSYQSNISLVGPQGYIWSDKETFRPRVYESTAPTSLWVAGQWAWDSREVRVLPGTPPGDYDIVLTLFDLDGLVPITFLEADGAVRGPTAVIGTITVTSPDQPPEIQPQYTLDAQTNGLHLLGYNQDRAEAIPGQQVLLILFWEKISGQSPTAEILNLSLLDDSGQPVQNWTIPPVQSSYPPSDWQPGERLRGQHSLRLPAGLESGRYQFRLEDIDLRTITVNAPERLFEAPEIETAVNASFDDQIQLTGYTTGITDGTLSVSLIWQALSELSTSYRVFVHLVDENGRIIVQSDGEPANWSRPTTGWANGEYIIDPHTLTLPNGAIPPSSTLRVGLYDPITNTRLMVDNGDFLSLSP